MEATVSSGRFKQHDLSDRSGKYAIFVIAFVFKRFVMNLIIKYTHNAVYTAYLLNILVVSLSNRFNYTIEITQRT